jgi:MFS family permease
MSPFRAASNKTFKSLRIRNYRLYFGGQIISMAGTWMQIVAQSWLVLQLTGSGVALGLVTALQFLPVLVAGAWGGTLADRFDKRMLATWTQVVAAVLALSLGLVVATGVVELWMVYAFAFLLGCVAVVDVPARQSFVMEMVPAEDVPNAIGLNTTIFTSARIVGPAIGAVLISTVGLSWCFFINGISFIAVIAGLMAMNPQELRQVPRVPRAKGQVREGLRYVWASSELRSTLLLMTVVGTLAFNFRILLPLMASSTFGGGAGVYGLLSSVMGVGTLLGALLSAGRARPTRALLVGSTVLFGILMVAAAAAPTLLLEAIALVPLGAVSIVFVATANSTLQLNSSDAMRGRVMALYSVVFLGSTPIGSPIVGWLAENINPRVAFLVPGIATLAAGLVALYVLRASKLAEGRVEVASSLPDDPSFWSQAIARPVQTLGAAGRWIRVAAMDLATRKHHRRPTPPGELPD